MATGLAESLAWPAQPWGQEPGQRTLRVLLREPGMYRLQEPPPDPQGFVL
jgi:hypothetical protein